MFISNHVYHVFKFIVYFNLLNYIVVHFALILCKHLVQINFFRKKSFERKHFFILIKNKITSST